ncbi:MAG: YfhO family protein [Chloroflexota bacterium]
MEQLLNELRRGASRLAVLGVTICGRGWVTAALFYGLILGILFWRAILLGEVLVPSDILLGLPPWSSAQPTGWRGPDNQLLSDQILQFYPYADYVRSRLGEGQVPLWNPFVLGGTPFLASPQTAMFYPINLLTLAIPLGTSLIVSALVRLSVAGIFTYLLCRNLGLSGIPSLFAGLASMLSAYNLLWLGYPHVNTAVFLPPMLYLMARGVATAGLLCAGLLAIATASAILGGHPESFLHILLVIVPFGIVMILRGLPANKRWKVAVARLAKYALGGLLGVGLAAVVILPFLDYLTSSAIFESRSSVARNPFSLPLSAAISFFAPTFYGSPVTKDYWGPSNMNEACGYVGVLTICLALIGITRVRSDWRARFFATVTLFALLIVYGAEPIFDWFTSLPGFRQGANHRLLFVAEFGLAVLAGLGLAEVCRWQPSERQKRLSVVLVTFGAMVILSGLAFGFAWSAMHNELASIAARVATTTGSGNLPSTSFFAMLRYVFVLVLAGALICAPLVHRYGRFALALAPVVLAADLLFTWYGYNPTNVPSTGYPTTPGSVLFLQQQTGEFRIVALPDATFIPNASMTYRLADIRGYEVPSLQRYHEFSLRLLGRTGGDTFMIRSLGTDSMKYLNLLGVRYLLSTEAQTFSGWRLVYDREVKVYENPAALPPAFFVSQAIELPRPFVVDALLDPSFDPTITVVVEPAKVETLPERLAGLLLPSLSPDAGESLSGPQASLRARAAAVEPSQRVPAATLHTTWRGSERIVLEVDAPVPGYVVLTNAYDPGWRAKVNGEVGEVLAADLALQAVKVPAGRSSVEVWYMPESVMLGAWLTVGSLGAVFTILMGSFVVHIRARRDCTTALKSVVEGE